MPSKIVDFSARSTILNKESFMVHFWECTPAEFLDFLKNPRAQLLEMGIDLPDSCRVETTIENHDWIGKQTKGFAAKNGTIVCNVGGGNVARDVYRVVSYGHDHASIGKFQKKLLHDPEQQEVPRK